MLHGTYTVICLWNMDNRQTSWEKRNEMGNVVSKDNIKNTLKANEAVL